MNVDDTLTQEIDEVDVAEALWSRSGLSPACAEIVKLVHDLLQSSDGNGEDACHIVMKDMTVSDISRAVGGTTQTNGVHPQREYSAGLV
jgi:hypothetical protein